MTTATNSSPLLTPAEAAEFLRTTVGTLAVWRCNRKVTIPFVKRGRTILYRRSALEAYLDKNTLTATPGKKGGADSPRIHRPAGGHAAGKGRRA